MTTPSRIAMNTFELNRRQALFVGGMGAQFFAVYVASSYVEGNRSANRSVPGSFVTPKPPVITTHPPLLPG